MSEKDDYFEKAESWAADSQEKTARSSRLAWRAAGVAAGIACFEAVALAMLSPLKTAEPITLLVDRQTGYVQALDPNAPRRVAADGALTQSFLAQYVTAREGFDRATVSADYRKVALWSSGAARSAYLAMMPVSNPHSPFNAYPAGTVVQIRVKSVSKLSDGVALVRFDTLLQDTSGHDLSQPWISTVRYRYVDAPMALEERLVNPLGFQVLSYRRDPETVSPETPSTSGTSGPFQPSASPAAFLSEPPQAQVPQAAVVPEDGRTVLTTHLPMGSPLAPVGQRRQ